MREVCCTNKTLLTDGVKVIGYLRFPVCGNSSDSSVQEDIYFNEIIVNQYLRGIRSALEAYKNSQLPNIFVYDQVIHVDNMSSNLYGAFLYNSRNDIIYVDFNTISDIYCYKANFVFGHEMGHKIEKYKASTETYSEIARILDVSMDGNFELLSEAFADTCGSIIDPVNGIYHMLSSPLTMDKKQALKSLVLKTVYQV